MKMPNFTEIRRRLPYGSIVKIAEKTGLTPKQVSDVLNFSWHRAYWNTVIDAALSIIEGMGMDENILTRAERLGIPVEDVEMYYYIDDDDEEEEEEE